MRMCLSHWGLPLHSSEPPAVAAAAPPVRSHQVASFCVAALSPLPKAYTASPCTCKQHILFHVTSMLSLSLWISISCRKTLWKHDFQLDSTLINILILLYQLMLHNCHLKKKAPFNHLLNELMAVLWVETQKRNSQAAHITIIIKSLMSQDRCSFLSIKVTC